jgi:kynurenine formamidase
MSAPFSIDLAALSLAKQGKVYDLGSGWWPGMPLAEGHPAFQVLTFRSPAGERNQDDVDFMRGNTVNFGFISELLMCTMHSGTHIDALAHTTCGPDHTWHGGHSSDTELGDFGPLNNDASELPPMLVRGVCLDAPGMLGVERLEAGQAVGSADLERICERQGVEPREGDVVLLRTGAMGLWPDAAALAAVEGAGLDLSGAEWLSARGVAAVGGDTSVLEAMPSGIEGDPQPVHRHLIHDKGIPILEWVSQEQLAAEEVWEFLFVCVPLNVRGATGSLVRPLAVA